MAVYPIRNLGGIGIVKDREAYDLPPNAFSSGLNVSIDDGAICKSLGFNSLTGLSDIKYGCGWLNSVESSHIYVKYDNSIHRWNGSTLSGFDLGIVNNGTDYYQSESVGTHILLNNGIDVPFVASPNDTSFSSLSNWDSTWRTKVVKVYKNFLVAIGIQKGATEYPMMIKWSGEIEPNSTTANWDETDITSLAGENTIAGGDGKILDIEELGDQMLIYTPSSVWSMQLIGGQFVFIFRKVFSDTGLASVGAVKEFDGKHFCVSVDDIYIHNGITKKSVADGRVIKSLQRESDDPSAIKVHKDSINKSMLVCYKTKSSASLNMAWVWNWVSDTWTKIELPGVVNLFTAPRLGSPVLFDDMSETYNSSSWTYSSLSPKNLEEQLLWTRSDGLVDVYGSSFTHNGSNYTSYVEQSFIDLDELVGQGTSGINQLKRIYPQISGEGDITIRTGGANSPRGAVSWNDPVTYSINGGHKLDVRTTKRYLAIRLESSGSGSWRLTGWDLDITPARYKR